MEYEGVLILSSRQRWQPRGIYRNRAFLIYEFDMPAYPQRYRIWEHFIGQEKVQESFDLSILAGQFTLSTSQIRDAVATARDMAQQRNGAITEEELFAAARIHSNPRLSNMARKIVPRYQWGDIVLPVDQLNLLHEIVDTVRGRPLVLDGWGLGRKLVSSKGITLLFAGPPGTGKTMAAEVIADELGLDLYKIDLSTVVSKYIGETEKNLDGYLISRGQQCYLFFGS
jgi:ATP-dependent 26S proteasome regulatory subunit